MLENLWGVICFCSKRIRDTSRPKVNPEDRFSALTVTIPNKYLNEIALGMRQIKTLWFLHEQDSPALALNEYLVFRKCYECVF